MIILFEQKKYIYTNMVLTPNPAIHLASNLRQVSYLISWDPSLLH